MAPLVETEMQEMRRPRGQRVGGDGLGTWMGYVVHAVTGGLRL